MKISIFKLSAVMNFIHQRYFRGISAWLVTLLLSIFVPGQLWALPETAVDFSQTAGTVDINTVSTSAPDILRSVLIVCPADGFVVAIANGGLQYSTVTESVL